MKWVWISVNSSRIGLVGRGHEKLVGHLKLFAYVCFSERKNNNKLLRNPKHWHTLQYDGHFTEEN